VEAFLTGVGWVTAAGIGRGKKGSFSWGEGDLPSISRKDIFADPRPHFGRMDRFSKIGLAAIAMALRDADIDSGMEGTIGVVASTVRGCVDTDSLYFSAVRDRGAQCASPHLFVFVTGSTFLGEASIEFGLRGPTLLLSEQEPGRCAVLASAVEMISGNQSSVMAAGICDISVGEKNGELVNWCTGGPAGGIRDIADGQAVGVTHGVFRPGGLFLVLEKDARSDHVYGTLSMSEGNLFFDGTPVNDITWLAAALSGR
jgi:3-oxoacyl-[acyl-carrier-protein] synthase II